MGRDQSDVAARVLHRGAGTPLDPSAGPEAISGPLREFLADRGYRDAAARIAEEIAEETATDRAVEEIEMVATGRVPA